MVDFRIIEYAALGFLVNFVYIVLVSLRYKYLLHVMKEKISLLHASCLFCVYQAVTYLDPLKIGGVVAKPVATRLLAKTSLRNAFLATAFEQVFDFIWQIPLVILAVLYFGNALFSAVNGAQLWLIGGAVVFGILVAIFFQQILNFFLQKIIPKKLRKMQTFRNENFLSVKKEILLLFKSPSRVGMMFLITAVFVLFSPFLLLVALAGFNAGISYGAAFLAYWVSFSVGRLSGIPGGFGSRDVTLLGMLVYFGIASGVALKAILLYRMITLIPNLLVGGGILLYYGGKYGFKIFSKEES